MSKKPIVNGRASICHWTLTASFLTKEQAKLAIEKFLAEGIDFPIAYGTQHIDGCTHHVIEIEDMSWARHLATASRILQEVDWHDECPPDSNGDRQ